MLQCALAQPIVEDKYWNDPIFFPCFSSTIILGQLFQYRKPVFLVVRVRVRLGRGSMFINLHSSSCLLHGSFHIDLAFYFPNVSNLQYKPRGRTRQMFAKYLSMYTSKSFNNIQLLNDFEVYINKYFAQLCNINRAVVIGTEKSFNNCFVT